MQFIDIAYATPENTHAQESVTSTGGNPLAAFGLDGALLGLQAFNFLLVFLVVWFLILKPLTGKMSERQKMIDDSIVNAQKIEKRMRQGETAFQEKIDQAKVEANRIIEKSRVEAENLSFDIKEKTKKDIDGLVANARANIREERDYMIVDLKKQTADLVIVALEKILGEKIDDKKDEALVARTLKDIDYEKK